MLLEFHVQELGVWELYIVLYLPNDANEYPAVWPRHVDYNAGDNTRDNDSKNCQIPPCGSEKPKQCHAIKGPEAAGWGPEVSDDKLWSESDHPDAEQESCPEYVDRRRYYWHSFSLDTEGISNSKMNNCSQGALQSCTTCVTLLLLNSDTILLNLNWSDSFRNSQGCVQVLK